MKKILPFRSKVINDLVILLKGFTFIKVREGFVSEKLKKTSNSKQSKEIKTIFTFAENTRKLQ